MSLVNVLELKYQQVAQRLDKAEMECQSSKFQADLLLKEKKQLQEKLETTQEQLKQSEMEKTEISSQLSEITFHAHDLQSELTK